VNDIDTFCHKEVTRTYVGGIIYEMRYE